MGGNFQESLSALARLSPDSLDSASRRVRSALGGAEWKMGLCLLAVQRSGAYRRLGYSTLTDYAERALQLSGRKVASLLGAAEALEHLPLISEAFRRGKICWTKVRSLHGLATPETEEQWLRFAAAHSSHEVANKVALSPRNWKRHQALKAHLAGKPLATGEQVEQVLGAAEEKPVAAGEEEDIRSDERDAAEGPTRESAGAEGPAKESPGAEGSDKEQPASDPSMPEMPPVPEMPEPPKTVRLVFELTPDQYALYEQAESRVRARVGRRIPRAEVLRLMADEVLSSGTARSRARHQVLVHTVEGSDEAWYDTGRGILPVSPEVLEEAKGAREVLRLDKPESGRGPRKPEVSSETASDRAVNHLSDSRLAESESLDVPEPPFVGETCVSSAETEKRGMDVTVPSLDSPRESVAKHPRDIRSGAGPDPQRATRYPEFSARPEGESPKHASDSRRKPFKTSAVSTGPYKRTPIPSSTLRRLHARANNCCERCGARGGRLDVHHTQAVSEGGGNDLDSLKLLCRACHSLGHEADFARKVHWRSAREAAMRRSAVQAGYRQSRRATSARPPVSRGVIDGS